MKDNKVGMVVSFAIAAAGNVVAPSNNAWLPANYVAAVGQVNNVAATMDTPRFTGVLVLPGVEAPTAAQSPLIMRPYDHELILCKRYWQRTTVTNRWNAYAAGHVHDVTGVFIVPFRAVATLLIFLKPNHRATYRTRRLISWIRHPGTFRHSLSSLTAGDTYAIADYVDGDAEDCRP